MKKSFLISIFTLIFFGYQGYTQQVKSFTTDTTKYLEEVRKFSNNYINESDKPVFDDFFTLWNTGRFTWDEMKEIIVISNLLIKKYGRPSPDFARYYELLIFSKTDSLIASNVNIKDCFLSIKYYLNKKEYPLKVTQQFLILSLNLLKENALYKSSSSQWKCIQSNYKFDFNNGFPLVRFENIDLFCFSQRDSISIQNTSGFVEPVELQWSGKNGIITWERAGLPEDSVYVELSSYTISLKKTEYTADSVLFRYNKYFNFPLEGRLEEQVMYTPSPSTALYPKFFSYQNKYILPNLFPGIEYLGGLSMQGTKLVGTGSEYEPAIIEIYEKDTLRMVLKTRQVLISQNSILSQNTTMTLILDSDSIYHPDLIFNYQEKSDLIRLARSTSYTSETPYRNTYHKVSMSFDEFSWKRNSREILFKPMTGSALGSAVFESDKFFNYSFWEQLQGMNNIHPLVAIWEYSKGIGFDQFPVINYANYLGIASYQVRHQLMQLSRMGFIYFNDVADMVKINDKLNYFIEACTGKIDYDVLYFISKIEAPNENAKLNLDNFDLKIFGVQHIILSDSQNVVLLPYKNQIILKRNRNFNFDGIIKAGLFTYYGSNFFFNYDTFKLNLQHIDSLRLEVKTGKRNMMGQYVIRGIDNLIEQVTGQLLIDDPANKSGLKYYPQYPIFSSRENAYVYFDEKVIQNGVYSKKDVFFEVYPFTIDSLDNFSNSGMKMDGTFESNGIIPPLDLTLSLREDYSLGFTYITPEEGIPVYKGLGTFYNTIEMSNAGLHGSGQLDYLTSTTYSDDFVFHPDSLMTISKEFINSKQLSGNSVPNAKSSNNKILWNTKQQKLFADMQNIPFTMFNDSVFLNGNILLEPIGLSGNGKIDINEAFITSNKYIFKSDQIYSDTANFKLKNPQSENLAFIADSLKILIDFNIREGQFYSNKDYTLVEFPDNRYISKVDFFIWQMNREILEMGRKKVEEGISVDGLVGPRYSSIVPAQDSLSFVSGQTFFDYRNSIISAMEVPYIQIADARIFPKNGEITVEKNAVLRRLTNAEIIADYKTESYKLYNASLDISGKNKYKGLADYDYIDETKRDQVIHFYSLLADTSAHTVGKGRLTVIDSFRLSPFFEFQGEVLLSALQPHLTFEGGIRLVHDCGIGRSWYKFKAVIDPDSVMIPISDTPLDINLNKIYAGTMITRDSTHIYSAFLGPHMDYFDAYINRADGFIRYDNSGQFFEIGPKIKFADKSAPGNYLKLDVDSCKLLSEGNIDFQVRYGQLKIKTVGQAENNLETGKFQSNVIMSLDFFFSQEALTILAHQLDSLPDLKPFDTKDPLYTLALRNLIGSDKAEDMQNELSLLGYYKDIPEEFNKNMVLSNVQLKWDQNSRSFLYHGPVGVIRIGNTQINKYVETYIQLSKRGSGDLFDIYFKVNNSTGYYFGYNPGSLQVSSTNREFNSIVMDLKDSVRKLKVRPGQTGFIYALAPDRRAELFLRRFMESEDEINNQR